MPVARKTVVDVDQVGVYHCISRCVRRAFLCGIDSYTGVSYEHRRGWIADRLKTLSSVFSMEVFAYAVMSNHLHVVVRNRPDLADAWSAEEVAQRWCRLFPKRDGSGEPEPPSEKVIAAFVADTGRVKLCRLRLMDEGAMLACMAYVDTAFYLSLVEWTGQNIRKDKPGYVPLGLKPVLERFNLDTEHWVRLF